MREVEVPFIDQPRPKTAAQLARETEIRLAREQPDPAPLPPFSRPAPEAVTAGSINLPFQSPDRFGLHFSHQRALSEIAPRARHCVSCGYDKLDTRLGDPERLGIDPRKLSAAERTHLGPGEREYGHCKVCFDTNGGVIAKGYYTRWSRLVDKEARQYTLRTDPMFAHLAERVAAIDAWRSQRGTLDLNSELGDVRAASMLTVPAPPDNENEFDGFGTDERVPTLSEFTGAKDGIRDPEFGALYDSRVVGAAETEAYMMDSAWEATRAENFRRAGWAAERIEDPQMRQEALERLVPRYDPRMSLVLPLSVDENGRLDGPVRMAMTNPLSEPTKRIRPYLRSASHSGVDEGFSSEPGWRQSAIARHEAAVADFMAGARRKLAQKEGMTPALLAELTTLPDLNPGREVVKLDFGPLRDRPDASPRLVVDQGALKAIVPDGEAPTLADRIMALRSRVRPTVLAPAKHLDQVAEVASIRKGLFDHWADTAREPAIDRVDPAEFRSLAEAAAQRREFQLQVRAANADRETVLAWASSINREDVAMRGATATFATEIRSSFVDPQQFQAAFKKLSPAEQREALAMLREQPATFAQDFATRFHRDFGPAGSIPRPDQDPHAFEAAFSKLSPAERSEARKMLREQPASFPQDAYTRFHRDFGTAGEIAGPDAARAGILVANAGEGYLDAKQSRDAVRRVNAERLSLPATASLDDVKQACRERFKAVNAAKHEAIAHRDAVRAPTRGELTRAFSGLHPADRSKMLAEMPALQKLVPIRRQREVARSGLGL
jgi:hypothetical protein